MKLRTSSSGSVPTPKTTSGALAIEYYYLILLLACSMKEYFDINYAAIKYQDWINYCTILRGRGGERLCVIATEYTEHKNDIRGNIILI